MVLVFRGMHGQIGREDVNGSLAEKNEKFLEIGESDRMTLKFVKPAAK